jgi:hypothetical protein
MAATSPASRSISPPCASRFLPAHGWAGLGVIVAAEALLFAGQPVVGRWFTPIVWTGYVLLVDAPAARCTGRSYLTNARGELPLLLLVSVGAWWLFEWYNAPHFWHGAAERRGRHSWLGALAAGDASLVLALLTSGLVCGLLWEFWNYWALTRWTYSVPYVGGVKLFEMPVLGYLGFPPFALECYAMYHWQRGWLGEEGRGRAVL